ncbi:MAG TPA: PQQ-binding-like beta-propeller repeat protein [Vicinamibacterales bacterium]|nr:PQQ-binding-like beta-propeller repeat protein [Vicinamibacterales bacterium]
MRTRLVGSALLIAVSTIALHASVSDPRNWAQWRGPDMTGVSRTAKPPLEWSETKNVKWKVEIPGRGSSSPVVWNDRVFLLTAIPVGVTGPAQHEPRGGLPKRGVHQYKVLAIDRASGKTIWERVANEEEPHEASHQDNGTWASSSAITDGEHVFAYFESRGLYAYDINGKPIWQTDFGDKKMRNQFGEGSTPVLSGNTLVVVWDHLDQPSYVIALNKNTGKELWRVDHPEMDTWATPLVVEHNGRRQVIVNAMNRVRSYDLETGTIVWEGPGTTMNVIPSPVFGNGMVFIMSGFRGNNLKAIKLADAKGDIATTGAIAWQLDRDTPYVPSPLLYDNILYFLKTNNGLVSALDAATGKPHYQAQRIARATGEVFSSPVGADGRVYITSRDGVTTVIKHGPSYQVLAENTLDDGVDASLALVDNEIFLRGYKYLYAISQ